MVVELIGTSNGHRPSPAPSKPQIERELVEEHLSAGYQPQTPISWFHGLNNAPSLQLFYRDLEAMLLHEDVSSSLDFYKGSLNSAEFRVTAKYGAIKDFVEETIKRFWQTSLSQAQESYDYGWVGAEIIYRKDDQNGIAFDRIKTFHPRHVKPLREGNDFWGVRVYNINDRSKNPDEKSPKVDLWAASDEIPLGKGFWHAHRPKHGRKFGTSQLLKAHRPWRSKATKDGGEQVIELAIHRHGVPPTIMRFPPKDPNYDPTRGNPAQTSNRDLAVQMGDRLKSGSTIAASSTLWPNTDKYQWNAEPVDSTLNVDGLLAYDERLAKRISIGIGVPPELKQAADVGSGYSGRQIPLEIFLEMMTEIVRELVASIREQIIEPLVRWRFGKDCGEFEIDVVPLLETRSKRSGIEQPQAAGPMHGPNGQFASNASDPTLLATAWTETKHPRDEVGQFAEAKMTLSQFDRHLRDIDQRHEYGPGLGGVKLAHQTHVADALAAGFRIPASVAKEYPNLTKAFPRVKPISEKGGRARDTAIDAKAAEQQRLAEILQEAASSGIPHDWLHSHAADLMKQDREFKDEHNAMLRHARQSLDTHGKAHRLIGSPGDRGPEDAASVPGMDVVAREMAGTYPGHFGNNTGYIAESYHDPSQDDAGELLFEKLRAGPLKSMTKSEAYEKALSQIMDYHDDGAIDGLTGGESDESDDVAKDPSEMTSAEFAAMLNKSNADYRRRGFKGLSPVVAKMNSPANRRKLAIDAGLAEGTPEFDAAVKSWHLHKLYVAAAKKRSEQADFNTSEFLATEIPSELSTDEKAILTASLSVIGPVRDRMFADVREMIATQPRADWWRILNNILDRYRDAVSESLATYQLGIALASMQRVARSYEALLDVPPASLGDVSPAGTPVASAPLVFPEDVGGVGNVDLSMIDAAMKDLSGRNLLTREQFDLLAADARGRAFTVANVESQSVLESLRDSLAANIRAGASQAEWGRGIIEQLQSNPFMSPAHQENVFRTNVHAAYSNGMNAILSHPLIADEYPYRAIFPIRDSRNRAWHGATETSGIDGTNVYRADDPTWKLICPPSDYECRCGWSAYTPEQAARAGVREAQEWLATGTPPANPRHVPPPPGWHTSPGWQRPIAI